MSSYQTPGVFIEEVASLPPSVAGVATAVPAFLGYTEKGSGIQRINTLLDFEETFGGPAPSSFAVTVTGSEPADRAISELSRTQENDSLLYYALQHYFRNGGGPCYVASVGPFDSTGTPSDLFADALTALAGENEPTLIVLTDAVSLPAADYLQLGQEALAQAAELGDRFVILDVPPTENAVKDFRGGVGSNHLAYGAAYYPQLETTLTYSYAESSVTVTDAGTDAVTGQTLEALKASDTALYNRIKAELARQRVILPPSAAVAGVYASVDRDRGVWKAPANVSLAAVLGPVSKITDSDQESLNVDATSGKSINAIRAFTGKGTLVWGARTLAGNDNEWRYVSVRRLFNTVEESCRKATAFAVFEPNDMTTWLKVQAMIEGYLYGLWEQGALAGPTSEAAYFVNVGLGKTMTSKDVLEGRMVVEVGLAAVRPAEFIVLRFSHKLQEA